MTFRGRANRGLILLSCLSLWATACDSGDEEPAGQPDAFVDPMGGAGGGGGMGGGGAGGAGGGMDEERNRLSFVRRSQFRDGSPTTTHLIVFDINDGTEFNLTQDANGEVDCASRLCALSPQMTSIGWLQRGENNRFSLFVAPVDVRADVTSMRIQLDQKREVATDVLSFAFTGDEETGEQLVYSQGRAAGAGDEVDVIAEPVSGEVNGSDCAATPYLCNRFIGVVNVDGGFKVTDSGRAVILLQTQLSCMTVGFTNLATDAQQTLTVFGECGGTGSQFSGALPVGLSPNGEFLAVFTRENFVWKLNTVRVVPNPPPPETLELFEEATVRPPAMTCQRPNPFDFNQVRFDPRFSPDGDTIYFLATGDCSQRNLPNVSRDDYDILSVNVDDLASNGVSNVTNLEPANHWSYHSIQDYDLSPDGSQIAFSAPAEFNVENHPIWVMNVEDGSFDCSRGTASPGLDGRERCVYIESEVNNGNVTHRGIRYHNVTVNR